MSAGGSEEEVFVFCTPASVQFKIILERKMNCTPLSQQVTLISMHQNSIYSGFDSQLGERVPPFPWGQIYVRDATVNGTRFIAIEKFRHCVVSPAVTT